MPGAWEMLIPSPAFSLYTGTLVFILILDQIQDAPIHDAIYIADDTTV
jgi:hypothetical protein